MAMVPIKKASKKGQTTCQQQDKGVETVPNLAFYTLVVIEDSGINTSVLKLWIVRLLWYLVDVFTI